MNIPHRPLWDFAAPEPDDHATDPEPDAPPNRWEVSDTPEEDIVDNDAMDGAEAQTLALKYGLDAILPAQVAAPGQTVRAIVLDTDAGAGWELNALEFTEGWGWFALSVYVRAYDAAGLARAAAWLLKNRSPLL